MIDKKFSRLCRASRFRSKFKNFNKVRLCVYKTSKHIYAQVISKDGGKVLNSACTIEKDIKIRCVYTGNSFSASLVGELIAKRVIKMGIRFVSFDRSGYKYHGRVKALADSARRNGLVF